MSTWNRTTSINTFGGLRDDYLGVGPINPKTDIGAEEFNRLVSDVASTSNLAPLATGQLDVVGEHVRSLITSIGSFPDYPFSATPVDAIDVTKVSAGQYTLRFPVEWSNSVGESSMIKVMGIHATPTNGVGVTYFSQIDDHTLELFIAGLDGSPIDRNLLFTVF